MAKKGLTQGMPINLSTLPLICEHCILGKQMKVPVLKSREGMRATSKLEIVYSDIAGPEAVEMGAGEKYMLNLVDNFTSCSWTYMLKKKSDAIDVFKDWKALIESEYSLKLSIICMDSGGEHTSNQFEAYLQCEGI